MENNTLTAPESPRESRSYNSDAVMYLIGQCKKSCKKACCRRSLLYGMLLLSRGHTGELSAELLDWLIRIDSKQPEPLIIDSFSSIDKSVLSCPECQRWFFCGVFLACGCLSDPVKGYRLELTVAPGDDDEAGELADSLCDYLTELGFPPLRGEKQRSQATVLYYRTSESVGDFLNLIGASQLAFESMNARIYKDFRNNANRLANCETHNIKSTVSAAQKQIAAIKELESDGRLSSLSEQLRETARLRVANPDAPLSELAALHTPPITKSCCVHRLDRIMKTAEDK